MRFNTIREFYEKGKICPFCGKKTYLFFDARDTGGFIDFEFRTPQDFVRFLSRKDPVGCAQKAAIYISYIKYDHLVYLYKGNSTLTDPLNNSTFSINIDDNSLNGDIDIACNLMWKHNLTVCVRCTNNLCFGSGFLFTYGSKELTVERKNRKVSPLTLSCHMFGVPNNTETNNSISFLTLNHEEETFIIDGYKIVTKIPRINLFSINAKDVEKKIKTFLIFS